MENLETKKKLWKLIDDTKDELLHLCSELIKRPNLNPPINPKEITNYILEYLNRHKIPYEVTGAHADMPIIIAKVGTKDGFCLCFNGHSDVVNPGDLSKWEFDPHSGTITEDRVLGRGSSDMLCGLAMDMHILRLIVENNITFEGSIVLHIVPDEESGGKYGTKWLVDNDFCKGIDAVILGEPTSRTNIETGSKGGLWAIAKAHGTKSHASIAGFAQENAIAKICAFAERIDELRKLKGTTPDSQKQVIENSKQIATQFFGIESVANAIDHVTYNICSVRSGSENTAGSEYCEMRVHFRIPNGINSEDLKAKFLDIAKECDVEVCIDYIMEAKYTPVESELVTSALANSSYLWGEQVLPVFQWASSDGLYYRSVGIQTIQNGPCNDGIHGYNETADIEEIINIAKNHFAIAADLLKINL